MNLLLHPASPLLRLVALMPVAMVAVAQLPPAEPPERMQSLSGNFVGQTGRPLRYFPDGSDFIITNGVELFNRPLYCMNSPFRIDGGDKPEFSLYLRGRGGNLRFGIKTPTGVKWLNEAAQIVTRYRPGSLYYEIRDPLLGAGVLRMTVLPASDVPALLAHVELSGRSGPMELFWAFGGANGMRGRRNGDIGCEREPVSTFFRLRPEQCRDHSLLARDHSFFVRTRTASLAGVASRGSVHSIADASLWNNPADLITSKGDTNAAAVVLGRISPGPGEPVYLALEQVGEEKPSFGMENLAARFTAAERHRAAIANRVVIVTPDPFINAAAAALNVAADGVWDEQQPGFMHGAVAWRVRLLGWRGVYSGDALGWHDRTRRHLLVFARQQNTSPIPEAIPEPEESANLSRNETALHSNGNMTKNHYDMNLVAVDAFFRHLLWTGDLDFAREYWPTLERHLAWERRLFRREFGEPKLPLYEGYASFWASDDVAYNGGGATYASACNYFHNQMAARLARLLGEDPSLYQREAQLIAQAMHRELWLPDRGWFAEFKDLLGLQLVHSSPAAWTFYHTIDSGVSTPMEAWQMTRFMDTQVARIPISGPNVPGGTFTTASSDWMPYAWSVNNVVMAETEHTALAYWQANRPESAFALFKGGLLDSMFLGLCPGNVGMCTYFDAYRHESQRDFADGVGATSRALIEGLFGAQPDVLAGELRLRPGFPVAWTNASIEHPDFAFTFQREGLKETYTVNQRFPKNLSLRLQPAAIRDDIIGVSINGEPGRWSMLTDVVGRPRIEITSPAAAKHEVVIVWRGNELATREIICSTEPTGEVKVNCGALITALRDPEGCLIASEFSESELRGVAGGAPGHHTVFAELAQGKLFWWQPVQIEIRQEPQSLAGMDWNKPLPESNRYEMIDLGSHFNDKVTQIFRNEYLSPRSPFCSLATPKQGIGSWCLPNATFEVDDAGLRLAAGRSGGRIVLPNGVPVRTPGEVDLNNIIFTSQWDNYPAEFSVSLSGRGRHVYLLMAGSTGPMQTRMDNGEVIVTYSDSSNARLPLHNPTTWWPIDQDYFIDDYAFRHDGALPLRVDLKTGKMRVLEMDSFKGRGGKVPGGVATVLDLPLDASKELKSLSVRALANEVVIGLMGVTLVR